MESTCKQYQVRFHRSGQFWTNEGDEALMCLETFWRNLRWSCYSLTYLLILTPLKIEMLTNSSPGKIAIDFLQLQVLFEEWDGKRKAVVYMKKALFVVGYLVVLGSVLCVKSLGGAADPAPGTEALLAKEAVTKVLGAHSFTPPLVLPGPPGSVWYFSSRAVNADLVEQAVVGVRSGNSFTVELSAFRRSGEQAPWEALNKSAESAIAKAELRIREQLQKELAGEEKAAKPEKPKQGDTTK